jgi:hypothetical protein
MVQEFAEREKFQGAIFPIKRYDQLMEELHNLAIVAERQQKDLSSV